MAMNKYEALAFIFAAMSTAAGVASIAWAWAKSRTARVEPSADGRRTEERLARIEQAVETIAIEVERVSEGQRFTTKLLAERADDGALVRPGRYDAR
jgi:hypothetical protein